MPSNFPNLHKRTKINSFLSVIAVIVLVRRIADMMPQEVKCEYLFAIDLILVMILIMQCIDNQVVFFSFKWKSIYNLNTNQWYIKQNVEKKPQKRAFGYFQDCTEKKPYYLMSNDITDT